MAREEPQWQPISQLPMIASLIEGMLADTETFHQTLSQAEARPHVMDDATLARVLEAYSKHPETYALFDEQLNRWSATSLDAAQRVEVERLVGQVARLTQLNTTVLDLAIRLKEGTIEKILAKDDFELGLEMLMGKHKF